VKLRSLLLLGSLAWAGAAQAAVDPSLLGQLSWRSIGPFRGGRVLAVAGVPGRTNQFYFGSVNGGVWKTDDAGRTWKPVFDGQPVASIGDLAVAPSAPDTVYVGTGEADMRSDIAQGQGLFKTTDGGATWRFIGLADSQQIGRILVDPRNPDVVLAAALGHPYGPNETRGVFRSTDGGATWSKTLFKNADTGAIDMAFAPDSPDIVYAALWQTRRPPWNVYPPSSGPGSGLYKSTDGGKTWNQMKNGLPEQAGRIGIAVSPADPKRVYALIDAVGGAGGLYRSDDHGATWTHLSDDKRIFNRGWYFGGVTADPANPDIVYVSDTIVLRSDDGGRHFIPIKGDPTGDDFHTMWIDSKNPQRRILGVDQGALVTLNGGATWSSWFNQPTAQFYHVVTDNRFPYRVYGAQQDSGAAGVPSRTGGVDGINMTEFHEITAGGEADNVAPDPDDPDTVFGGRVDKLDLRTGQTRNVDPTLAFPDDYRGTWTLPLVFGKADHALYFGNQRVFRTTDGGERWTPISPDLTRETPKTPATLDAPTLADTPRKDARRGVVYSIGPSPLDAKQIWAGTDDGLVWRTSDGGVHWSNLTPKALTDWSKIGAIEPSHSDPETAYIAVDRHRLDDFRPYAYRTHDGGKTWRPITDGLEKGGVLNAVNVVREDPLTPGLLFAGTERGAFVSFNDGDNWQPLQSGLPVTSVRDIEVHGDDLVIATHGRGFYIMDDMASLRELKAHPEPGTRLFAPATAIRTRDSGFTGTPMPKDEPMAPNPPNGAYIDYALAAAPKGPVEITIRDASGALVRHFSSADAAPRLDLAKLEVAPEWVIGSQPLDATPGAHRLVWNFRYAAAPGLDDDPHADGAWAPPGVYDVELKVDGHTERRKLVLKPDPRVKAAPQTYVRAFELERRVEVAQAQVKAALAEAAAMHKSLVAQQASADAAGKARLAALDARLIAVTDLEADKDPRNPFPAPPRSLVGLRFLQSRLAVLSQAIDGADGGPSADTETGLKQTETALAATMTAFQQVKATGDRTTPPRAT
jgi:photosystem II stability/assembly factor-like uncharacterized protein